MDEQAKKTALRMIPYGLYVLTGAHNDELAAATVNWVTQTAFKPPQVVVGMKADSGAHDIIKQAGYFALNILGQGQDGIAYAFFKPAELDGDRISGQSFKTSNNGCPILDSTPAFVECRLVHTFEGGDHSVFVGEVLDAEVRQQPSGRADEATLTLKDLGEKVFYGG